jgi:hypothetical protein
MPVARFDRGIFFWGLIVLASANGLCAAVVASINHSGWQDAAVNSFDVSAIVWISIIAGILLIKPQSPSNHISKVDLWLGIGCFVLICIPAGPPSWVALTILSARFLMGEHSPAQRRGAIIVLATTVPMFWSRLCFQFFADTILSIDASLVSWLVGTARNGNMVEFVNGPGYLVIYPTCSSLANMSLAVLCWVALVQLLDHKWRDVDFLWCGLTCLSVVAINVIRMSLMAHSLNYYEAIHSNLGDIIANIIFIVAVLGICLRGVRHEIFARV